MQLNNTKRNIIDGKNKHSLGKKQGGSRLYVILFRKDNIQREVRSIQFELNGPILEGVVKFTFPKKLSFYSRVFQRVLVH